MKERPILFSGPMVKAILAGRKTQTRRVIKCPPKWKDRYPICAPSMMADPWSVWFHDGEHSRVGVAAHCPCGKPGDRLWVREGWRWYGRMCEPGQVEGGFEYRADQTSRIFTDFAEPEVVFDQFRAAAIHEAYQWRPSIFMPRWASRISLEVLNVRAERLQEISADDVDAEGLGGNYPHHPDCSGIAPYEPDPALQPTYCPMDCGQWTLQEHFSFGWDSLNAKSGYSWASNPFVWVIEFKQA